MHNPDTKWCSHLPFCSSHHPSRWLLAAQQYVTALQTPWFVLLVQALCWMDAGVARCVLHSLTRTAALWGLVTTTKGWSVIMVMMWPWPGASVEVREEETIYQFTLKNSCLLHIQYLHYLLVHSMKLHDLFLKLPILKIKMGNGSCYKSQKPDSCPVKEMDINLNSFPYSQSYH